MAQMSSGGIAAEMDRFEKLARGCEPACEAAVKAGGKILAAALSKNAPVLKAPRSGVTPGALRDSIKVGKPESNIGDGTFVEVAPKGTDHGQNLAKIGNILEYGRSNMAAQPWFNPTIIENEGAVLAAIDAEFAHYQRMQGG